MIENPTSEPKPTQRNEAAIARFVAAIDGMRRSAIDAARAIVEVDDDGAFVYESCASVGELGERHGVAAAETWRLLALGRALEVCPDLEARVLDGRIPLHSASLLGDVLADPTMSRAGDEWLKWAESESTRVLRRRIERRREEVRLGEAPAVALTVFVSPKGRDEFRRARSIASRKADRALTEGETLETVVDHYLDSFDPARRGEGSRRVPHTSTVPGRYVPAGVQRHLRARDRDRCAVPYCDHEVFLQNAHVVAHASGGHREADNLLRLCTQHHRMLDEGRLTVVGPADAPTFRDPDGRDLSRRSPTPAARVDGPVDEAPT